MSKSRSFSIYLLKDGVDASNALKEDHALGDPVNGDALPEGATLYILDSPPHPPWWKSYFGITENLLQEQKGAVVFLSVGKRTFSITFGHVQHNLRDTAYEYDFGLRVTLNCLDPEKLKSTDILEPNGAKRRRTQLPVDSDLTYFDFDRDATILKSLTGKVRPEFKEFFKHATGASNIRVSSDVTPEGLPQLCAKLLELYEDESYKTNFPDIQNIAPVRDPIIKEQLNAKLIASVRSKNDPALLLSVPEILDFHDGLWVTFAGAGHGQVYDDVFLDRYYEYLDQREQALNTIDIETLKRHCLVLTDQDGKSRGERHSIFKSLIFDTALDGGQTYHLCDGEWYLVEANFITRMTTYLDPFCAETILPAFAHENEGAFNESCTSSLAALVCLDTTSIAPAGQKAVEPCDLFEVKDGRAVLHHVKISTMSAQLSHLFNQGTNSVHLLRDDDEARGKLKALITDRVPANVADRYTAPVDADALKVAFDVITHKDPAAKSANFPLFSRISLMRAIKDLKRMGIEAEFTFVKDESAATEGRKKTRKRKDKTPMAANDAADEAEVE